MSKQKMALVTLMTAALAIAGCNNAAETAQDHQIEATELANEAALTADPALAQEAAIDATMAAADAQDAVTDASSAAEASAAQAHADAAFDAAIAAQNSADATGLAPVVVDDSGSGAIDVQHVNPAMPAAQ